jgi:hypothetical protein
MKYSYIFLAIAAIIASQTGCRPKPLPIELPQADGKMVVASQIIPNTTMLITLSRSFNALTPTDTNPGNTLLDQILVTHAMVIVKHGGSIDTLKKVAPGFYGSINTPLIENETYELFAYDSSSGKSVTATTQMQKRIKSDTAWIELSVNKKDTTRFLNLRFTDPTGVNYYMINTYRNTSFFTNLVKNPASVFNISGNADVATYPVTDQLFSGPVHLEKIELQNFQKNDTLSVTLSQISAEYYTYLVQKQRAARNGLSAFFGEPVNYSSNVNGGYGFFTAHWPDARSLIIKE